MSSLVRVARDGSALIVKTDDGEFVRTAADGDSGRASAMKLEELTQGGGWRRVVAADRARFAEAAIVAAGKVFVDDVVEKPSIYRVPPTVQKSIQSALEMYSPILSDDDREIARRLASQTQVERADIEWMHKFFENIEKALALHGGRRGQTWARKVLSDEPLTADGGRHEIFSEEDVLFVAGTDETETDLYDTLYMVDPVDGSVYVWENGDFSALELKDGEIERERLTEVDPDTARQLSTVLDDGFSASLSSLFPAEKVLFDLAESELDEQYLSLLADATGYSPAERSHNAQRQPRNQGGQFGGGGPVPEGKTQPAQTQAPKPVVARAKLPADLPLLESPAARIDEYLAQNSTAVEPATANPPADQSVVAAGEPGRNTDPLYLAIVDPVDKTAVLDVVSIAPDEAGQVAAWRREAGAWVAAPELLADVRGDTPPPLVELSDESTIKNVLAQVDQSDGQVAPAEEAPAPETIQAVAASAAELGDLDGEERDRLAKKGYALPDGSFPIKNESDLKNAISAYGRAKDKDAARKHIRKRARALNRADLIPDSWKELAADELVVTAELFGPYGEVLVAAGVPGVADTPEDFRNVARLKRYWAFGPGAAKIRWGTPGDLTRAHKHLSKYVGPKQAWGLAQNLHKMVFGVSNAKHDKAAGQ